MSNTEKPDVATVDGNDVDSRLAFADKAESLLRRVLVALGYDNADKLTPADLLTSIKAWVSMLHYAKLDAFGRYSQTWWEGFKLAWQVHPTEQATQCATDAMNAFVRMFPPTLSANDEGERDTINDIAALSEELDKQTVIVAGLQSENAALLRANEHHASELASCRIETDHTNGALQAALNMVKADCDVVLSRESELHVMLRNYGLPTEPKSLAIELAGRQKEREIALVPLAKPEHVEVGQHYAFVCIVSGNKTLSGEYKTVMANGDIWWANDRLMAAGIYLGTDKV